MDDKTFLKQKIEFLEIQLKDFQSREQSLKSQYDSIITSVLAVTSPNISHEHTLKIEEIKKNHSNELLVLKFFYKQRTDLLQEKIAKLKNTENKEIQRLNAENLSLKANIKELSIETQHLNIQKQIQESKLDLLKQKEEEVGTLKQKLIEKKQSWKVKKTLLTEENLKNQENIEKNVNEIKNHYEKKQQSREDNFQMLKKLEELLFKLSTNLAEHKDQKDLELNEKFSCFLNEIDSKIIKIFLNPHDSEKNDSALTVKNRNLTPPLDPNWRIFNFASPSKYKQSDSIKILEETCKKIQNSSQKPPIHSPLHKRSLTQNNLSANPFVFQCSDRLSLQETHDSSQIEKNNEKTFQSPDENLMTYMKIQMTKLKNQRNRGKIENEKILLELKDSKLNLAYEKEKNSEKMIQVENEAKKIKNIVKRMPDGLENIQREIARSVHNITKILG